MDGARWFDGTGRDTRSRKELGPLRRVEQPAPRAECFGGVGNQDGGGETEAEQNRLEHTDIHAVRTAETVIDVYGGGRFRHRVSARRGLSDECGWRRHVQRAQLRGAKVDRGPGEQRHGDRAKEDEPPDTGKPHGPTIA